MFIQVMYALLIHHLLFLGDSGMKKIIELKNITKAFDGDVVLDNIGLDIYDNEFLTLLGPSGCGKTTTLRIIGGFETADSGRVMFDGKEQVQGLMAKKLEEAKAEKEKEEQQKKQESDSPIADEMAAKKQQEGA